MRALVIEDDTDVASNIAEYLEPKGFVLDFAYDGVSGLHFAATRDYDVLVLDVMLPGIDGFALCRRLRSESASHAPVLMLTARDALSDKIEGFEAGADDYLVKPFALPELYFGCALSCAVDGATRSPASGFTISSSTLVR